MQLNKKLLSKKTLHMDTASEVADLLSRTDRTADVARDWVELISRDGCAIINTPEWVFSERVLRECMIGQIEYNWMHLPQKLLPHGLVTVLVITKPRSIRNIDPCLRTLDVCLLALENCDSLHVRVVAAAIPLKILVVLTADYRVMRHLACEHTVTHCVLHSRFADRDSYLSAIPRDIRELLKCYLDDCVKSEALVIQRRVQQLFTSTPYKLMHVLVQVKVPVLDALYDVAVRVVVDFYTAVVCEPHAVTRVWVSDITIALRQHRSSLKKRGEPLRTVLRICSKITEALYYEVIENALDAVYAYRRLVVRSAAVMRTVFLHAHPDAYVEHWRDGLVAGLGALDVCWKRAKPLHLDREVLCEKRAAKYAGRYESTSLVKSLSQILMRVETNAVSLYDGKKAMTQQLALSRVGKDW